MSCLCCVCPVLRCVHGQYVLTVYTQQLADGSCTVTNSLTDSTHMVSPHGLSYQNTPCFIHNLKRRKKFRNPAIQRLVLLWDPRYSCRIKYICDTAYGTYRLADIAIMMATAVTCTMWFLFAQMLRHDVWCNALEVLVEDCRKVTEYEVNGTER